MKHASKYVYFGSEEDQDEVVHEEELNRGLFESLASNDSPSPSIAAARVQQIAAEARERRAQVQHKLARKKAVHRPLAEADARGPATFGAGPNLAFPAPAAPPAPLRAQANVNVVAITFGNLADQADAIFAGDPIYCKECRAILNKDSQLVDKEAEVPAADQKIDLAQDAGPGMGAEEDGNKVWKCEFCGGRNVVSADSDEVPTTETIDYVIEPAPEAKQAASSEDDSYVIFCIDVSGSMCVTTEVQGHFELRGAPQAFDLSQLEDHHNIYVPRKNNRTTWVSRLQAVKAAVDKQLEVLANTFPNKKVGLVAFNREVTIIGDGTSATEVVAGDKLFNHQGLQLIGRNYNMEKPISESRQSLSDRLFALEEDGPTALGPALLIAVSMAAKKSGSSVIVCTDGLANVGVGALDNLDDAKRQETEQWYDGVGNYARLSGVTVSVISLKGDECSLEDLGRVAEATSGSVDRVDPLELTKNFASILANPVIATNVSAHFILSKALRFTNEEVVPGSNNLVVREVGNVTKDTEFTFQYEVVSREALQRYAVNNHVPFQIQINFTKLDGMKCLRVISKSQEITNQRQQAVQDVDLNILSSNAAQTSAKLAKQGKYHEARVNALAYGKLIQKSAVSSSDSRNSAAQYANFVEKMDRFDAVLQNQELDEADDDDDYVQPQVQARGAPVAANYAQVQVQAESRGARLNSLSNLRGMAMGAPRSSVMNAPAPAAPAADFFANYAPAAPAAASSASASSHSAKPKSKKRSDATYAAIANFLSPANRFSEENNNN